LWSRARSRRAGSAGLRLTVPGIGWVLAFTIASEIGDISRFPSAKKLCGYTGLCPRVHQCGESDRRGPLTKQGPMYLRWAMLESACTRFYLRAKANRIQTEYGVLDSRLILQKQRFAGYSFNRGDRI
jgi:transposase